MPRRLIAAHEIDELRDADRPDLTERLDAEAKRRQAEFRRGAQQAVDWSAYQRPEPLEAKLAFWAGNVLGAAFLVAVVWLAWRLLPS